MASSASLQLPVQKRAWDTRERILAAAVDCLAEEGYVATTTSRIQERAGVSRGSLLHQFPARDDLLIAAVHHLAQQRTAEIPADAAHGVTIDVAIETVWATFHGPLFRASFQLWVAAEHNPDLAAALRPGEHELGHRIRAAIAELFGPEHAAHPGFGDMLQLLLSSMRGVALTYTFQPRDHDHDPNLALWKGLAHRTLEAPAD